MKVFIAALDEGGLRKAGRKLGRSPATISRALAFLETHVGVSLLHRTTRSFKLSEAGERYAVVCRRVISDHEEADLVAAGGGAGAPGLPAKKASTSARRAPTLCRFDRLHLRPSHRFAPNRSAACTV